MKVEYYTTCSDEHRGLYRFRDAVNFKLAEQVGSKPNLFFLGETVKKGDYCLIPATAISDAPRTQFVRVSHQRYRDPKLAFLHKVDGDQPTDDDDDVGLLGLDHRWLLQFGMRSVLDACTAYSVAVQLLAQRSAGVNISVKVFNVQNFDHRVDSEQCIFRKVKTVSVRQEATIHNPAQVACAEMPAHKKPVKPASSLEPESEMDMFEIGLQALKHGRDATPKTSKSSLSLQTPVGCDER